MYLFQMILLLFPFESISIQLNQANCFGISFSYVYALLPRRIDICGLYYRVRLVQIFKLDAISSDFFLKRTLSTIWATAKKRAGNEIIIQWISERGNEFNK